MLPPSSTQETSGLRGLVEPVTPLVLDARNLDREIVQEFQERVDYSAKKHPSSPGSSINSPHGLILFAGVCVLCSRARVGSARSSPPYLLHAPRWR
jgi:hypothetical protein